MNETNFKRNTNRCPYCNRIIEGRTDKMFCDDRCRNNYYYKVNSEQKSYIRYINKILLKNRGILRTVNPYGRKLVSKRSLEELGFDFNCYTSVYKTRKGKEYYLVYDQAYSFDDPENLTLLVFYRDA
ncbi:MAG: hypothetical protein J6P64_02570 [Bacteroidales bacterium]|jgi:hypothetical protein|nr:hypothetical protein [Bacteroidales bacterium]